jgi:ABC-type transport system substrate-binding protein
MLFKSKDIWNVVMNRFFIVIHISLVLISCQKESNNSDKHIFRYNSATGITSLDPAFARTQENIRTVNQLFNGLVSLDSNLNIVPDLAQRWTISENGLLYTFHLRNDVFFHNDPVFKNVPRRLKAQDFVYSFGRLLDPKVASDGAWIFNGVVNDEQPFLAINDSTFQIQLKKPFAPFLSMLTMAYCYVVPREAVEHYKKDFGKHPVSTGLFKFGNWQDGIRLNLIRSENYFDTTVTTNIDAISVSFIQSKQTELLEFLQGNLSIFSGLESSYKDEVLNANGSLNPKYAKQFQLVKSPFLNTEYLAFNLEDKQSPLYDKNLRKAMSLAIDREVMVKYLRNSIGTPALGGFIPKGLPMFSDSLLLPNLTLAKSYLEQSSYSGEEVTLTTTKDYLDLCILAQKNLADIGINIKVDVVPSSLLKQQKSSGKLAFFRSSWIADYPDGENYLACFYSKNKAPNGPNYTRFSNERFDELYLQLVQESAPEKRNKIAKQMEKIMLDECPFILLFYDESFWLHRNEVKGITINSLNHLSLKNVVLN